MNDNTIKTVSPTTCPHCSKEFMTVFEITAPTVKSSLTPDMIAESKNKLKLQVRSQAFDASFEKTAIEWINDENTIFSEEEIETLLNGIKEDYSKTTK